MAWTGATVNQVQPDPGNDGIAFVGYKVTNPSPGVYHYEYAIYNENLDRSIQSFSVPLMAGVNISNIGFHAPPQEPGWANDGTFNNQGYSSTPWAVTQVTGCQHGRYCLMWNSETFAQNQNANAIRFGTLYNFRFDADQPPTLWYATIGFFKTGSPMMLQSRLLQAATLRRQPRLQPRRQQLPRHCYRDCYCYCNTADQLPTPTRRSVTEASSNSATAPLACSRRTEQKSKRVC